MGLVWAASAVIDDDDLYLSYDAEPVHSSVHVVTMEGSLDLQGAQT